MAVLRLSNLIPLVLCLFCYANCACTNKSEKKDSDKQETFSPAVGLNGIISLDEAATNYTTDYSAIVSLGANSVQTAAPWGAIETTDNDFNWTMVTNGFFGINALSNYGFSEIFINISIIAMSNRSMPNDLDNEPFNAQTVKDRLHAYIDLLLPQLNSDVHYISLGNEVNYYFDSHSDEWNEYKELIDDAADYIRSKRPSLKVGVTTTFGTITNTYAAEIASLNENMDFIGINYYPQDNNHIVREPDTVFADLELAVTVANGKPIIFQEYGYQTNADLNGSEAKQAQFVRNTFSAWRRHGTDKIAMISFFKYRDWTPYDCANRYAPPGGPEIPSTHPIYKYLCSLGLLNNDRTPKAAMTVLQGELEKLR